VAVDWPTTPCNDPVAELGRQFVLNLEDAIGRRSVREIARVAGVDRASIGSILNGRSWPDMVTVAKLELCLGPLWPRVDSYRR